MTAILHTGTRTLSALAATSAESAYPVSNLQTPAIRKPWRSTSTASQNVDIDLGSAVANPIICLQGCNASSITVSYGTASYTTVSLGALATAQDRHGTRRLSVSIPASARYVRLVFIGTPADAAAYWWGGALYVFGSTLALPDDPLLGSEVNARYPQSRVELPNGNRITIDRGAPRQQINLRFRTSRVTDIDALTRAVRSGLCWLDLGIDSNRELQWPVMMDSDTAPRTLSRADQDDTSIALLEVA